MFSNRSHDFMNRGGNLIGDFELHVMTAVDDYLLAIVRKSGEVGLGVLTLLLELRRWDIKVVAVPAFSPGENKHWNCSERSGLRFGMPFCERLRRPFALAIFRVLHFGQSLSPELQFLFGGRKHVVHGIESLDGVDGLSEARMSS